VPNRQAVSREISQSPDSADAPQFPAADLRQPPPNAAERAANFPAGVDGMLKQDYFLH
jgi:hypothetical protein